MVRSSPLLLGQRRERGADDCRQSQMMQRAMGPPGGVGGGDGGGSA